MTSNNIQGDCDPRFARVREAFEENLASRDELGAGVCVYVDGEKLVDLWGGAPRPQGATATQLKPHGPGDILPS